ncbi:MAG: response regulator [Micrococcales bacterium]|nr:response regulator [Micrococcales bacterium]
MLRDIPIRALLVVGFLAAGLLPLMMVAIVSYEASRSELKKQAFRQLESARTLEKAGVERFFDRRVRDVSVLAHDPTLRAAFDELCAAYRSAGGAAGHRLAGHDRGRFDAPASYRQVHDRHLPFFARYVEELGFYDLLLLDATNGETCFSVEKESDFAAVVAEQHTALADVLREVRSGKGEVLSDTRPYHPSANAAAQFVAAPIVGDGETVIGVVALQISIDSIDAIVGERAGMGRTGDTCLIGSDGRLRSDSRLDRARTVEASFRQGPTSGRAESKAARRALAGVTGSGIFAERDGRRMLVAFAPVDLGSFRWAIVAAISEREIDEQIDRALNGRVAVLLAGSTVVAIALALLLSFVIARGVHAAAGQIGRLSEAVLSGDLSARGDPYAVPRDLHGVVRRVNGLIDALVRVTDDKRRLEERLARMQRLEAIGTLAGGIAHDFNNILTSLFAYLDIVTSAIEGAVPAQGRASSGLRQIEAGLERAAVLVKQILTFSRQLHARPRPLDLALVVREALGLVQVGLPPSVRVELDVPERPFQVLADPGQLHQAVVNLLINAHQAMGDAGGRLAVAIGDVRNEADDARLGPALRPGAYVALTVRDTGCGMDEATIARIFEPFFTTKPVGQGTGMGLSLVHGVVSGAGGAVLVDSELGVGTTFRVVLPRTADVGSPEEIAAAAEPGGGHHVLFVDDDEHLCRAAGQMLESLGYHARTVTSGREALEAFRAAPEAFDAVVVDLSMPEVGGLDVAAAVHAERPDLPVVLSTAHPERVTSERARAVGVAEVLLKPYRRSDLARLLARLLASS